MTIRCRTFLSLVWLLLAATVSLADSPPAVSNRAPAVGDIGYLPAPGATVATNPPALAWLPEPGADGYAVQLARDSAFRRNVLTIERTPYVLYTHIKTLAAGAWYWRYACLNKKGARSMWSQVRSLTVPANAQPFPRPDQATVDRRIPSRHPRLMLRPEELPEIRQTQERVLQGQWKKLVDEAEEYLKLPLIPEPPPWTGGEWNAEEWRRNYAAATTAASRAETLAFCYLLSGEARYGEGARRWLLHIASWNSAGTTSMEVNDEAGMPILYLTSRAYDWAYNALSEADRKTLRAVIRARGEEAYHWLHSKPAEQKAYNSHAGRMWHFLGEAAIAFYGEIPEAEKWLDYALTIFWGWYPVYGDEDGGWAQGLSYWTSYVNRSTWWFDALHAALGIDGTEKPFYQHVGDFPLYVAPPSGSLMGFGDFGEQSPDGNQAIPVAFFARMRQKPEWQWYARAWGRPLLRKSQLWDSGPIGYLRSARPLPPVPAAREPKDWPTAKWFRGAGWAVLHTNLTDGAQDVQVMFRSAPLGNISHSHSDQNAFLVGAYGVPLLVSTGIRPWYGSPFCEAWYWTTKAHNALEVDGEGQPKTREASGNVLVFRPGPNYDYVVGDATAAYAGRVKRYRRHLLFLKPDVLIVLDEVQANRPVPLKFWLHGRAPFTFDQGRNQIALTFRQAALSGFLLAPGGLQISQTDQYPLPPETGKPEPEWHLWAETKEKQAKARVVAVLGIGRAGEKAIVEEAEDVSTGETVAVRFRRSGKLVTVAFDPGALQVSVEER